MTCAVDECGITRIKGQGLCGMHYARFLRLGSTALPPKVTDHEYFMKHSHRGDFHQCWTWTGAILPNGYGMASVGGRKVGAHRLSHELFVGPIPEGFEVDHLCRKKDCVNPTHLEAVTPLENTRRAHAHINHCPAGHPKTPENLIPQAKGSGKCRVCHRDRARIRRAAQRELISK